MRGDRHCLDAEPQAIGPQVGIELFRLALLRMISRTAVAWSQMYPSFWAVPNFTA
jgi:hypothetical protein